MSIINSHVLGAINQFRTTLDSNLGCFVDFINKNFKTNLFSTYNYKLYSLISENVRMDLNYLVNLNPDYDLFGFPGVHRNIRNSIEAYFDLYNLTCDKNYTALMKFVSGNARTDKEEYKHVLHYADILEIEPSIDEATKKKRYNFPISSRVTIAEIYGNTDIVNLFKPYIKDANTYVHADVFVTPPANKSESIEKLLYIDILLLYYSFQLLSTFVQQNFNYATSFSLATEYENCMTFLNQHKGYYITQNLRSLN